MTHSSRARNTVRLETGGHRSSAPSLEVIRISTEVPRQRRPVFTALTGTNLTAAPAAEVKFVSSTAPIRVRARRRAQADIVAQHGSVMFSPVHQPSKEDGGHGSGKNVFGGLQSRSQVNRGADVRGVEISVEGGKEMNKEKGENGDERREKGGQLNSVLSRACPQGRLGCEVRIRSRAPCITITCSRSDA